MYESYLSTIHSFLVYFLLFLIIIFSPSKYSLPSENILFFSWSTVLSLLSSFFLLILSKNSIFIQISLLILFPQNSILLTFSHFYIVKKVINFISRAALVFSLHFPVLRESKRGPHRLRSADTTEYTHSGNDHHDGKISPAWCWWVVHAHPLSLYLPSCLKL